MDSEQIHPDEIWSTVVAKYFDEHGLVRHQLDSYNHFVFSSMMEIIEDYTSDRAKVEVRNEPIHRPGEATPKYVVFIFSILFH